MNCVCRLLVIINFNEKRYLNLSVEESFFNIIGFINLVLVIGISGGKVRVGLGIMVIIGCGFLYFLL